MSFYIRTMNHWKFLRNCFYAYKKIRIHNNSFIH